MLEGIERASEKYTESVLLYIIAHKELEVYRGEFIDEVTGNFYSALYATCIKCEKKEITSIDDPRYENLMKEEMSVYPTMDEYAIYFLKTKRES